MGEPISRRAMLRTGGVLSGALLAGAGVDLTRHPLVAAQPAEMCFPETGKCIRDPFLRYWLANGGLRQQGLPLTDEFDEVNPTNGQTYRVQYFERARFEYHPEFAGTENEVLLGLLGREQLLAGQRGAGGMVNLDNDVAKWQIYIDPQTRKASRVLENVRTPSLDGTALHVGLGGGDAYTGIQAYYTLPPAPLAQAFQLSLHWRFSATTFNNEGSPSRVQAVELAMNKWDQGRRFEWGLQWENVGDGTSEQGSPPTWRLWDGRSWRNVGPAQRLNPDEWHYFLLQGDIMTGQVRYVRFVSDGIAVALGQTYPPMTIPGDQVTVAFQLDGNYQQDQYECFFDKVSLQWFPVSPW